MADRIQVDVDGFDQPFYFDAGTDPAVIQSVVKRMVAQKQNASGPQPITTRGGLTLDERIARAGAPVSPLPQLLGNVARGGVDIIGGGAQLLSRAANAMGVVPESNPGGLLAGPKDVEAQNAQARTNIDKALGPQEPGLVSAAERYGSGGLLTMPLTPLKALLAPSLLTRTIGAGISGGEAAAIQPVDNPQSTSDYFKKKAVDVPLGTAAGIVAQPIAEKVVSSIVAGFNALADKGAAITRGLTGANDMNQLVGLTRSALANNGIDYNALSEQAKQKLLGDVQGALKSYSGINPGAVARQAAFTQEGFDPLRHWITRDPAEFTTIENLSHIPGVGDPLMTKKAALDQHIADRLNQMRGPVAPPQDAGTAGLRDLSGYLGQQQGKTNVLYRTFQDIAPDLKGDPQRFANDVFGGLEGQMAGAALPGPLREIVNKISAGEIPLTPSTLYQLQKMARPGADGTANYAMGHLSRAIDREMNAISQAAGTTGSTMPVIVGAQLPDQQGQYAADVLKMARGQHAKVMGELESSPVLAGVDANKIAPENFVDRLTSTSLDDLKSTWGRLGDDAKDSIRSQIYGELKQKAFANASDNSGKQAAQATFVNYVNDPIESQKLKIILGDDGYQGVKRLGTMLEAAKMQPSGSAVNNSKTGGALVGTTLRLGQGMKDLGIWGGGPLSGLATKSLAQNVQMVPPEALGRQSLVIDPAVEEILKRRAGNFMGLLGGASTPDARKGLLGQSS